MRQLLITLDLTPTSSEMRTVLPGQWVICRNTPANREKYGARCISPLDYRDKQLEAVGNRYARRWAAAAPR